MRKPSPQPKAPPAGEAAKPRVAKAAAKPIPANKKPHTGGKPPHEPTPETRLIVKLGVLAGMLQERIARMLKIDPTTLRKHYADEIEQGGDEFMVKVVGNLAKIATDPNHPKAVTAAIWLTRTRLGWKDGTEAPRQGNGEDAPNDGAGPIPKGTVFTLQLTGSRNLQVVGGKDAV